MMPSMMKMLLVWQAVQMAIKGGLRFWSEKHALEVTHEPAAAASSQPILDGQALSEHGDDCSSAPAHSYDIIVLDTDDDLDIDDNINDNDDCIDLVTEDDET